MRKQHTEQHKEGELSYTKAEDEHTEGLFRSKYRAYASNMRGKNRYCTQAPVEHTEDIGTDIYGS